MPEDGSKIQHPKDDAKMQVILDQWQGILELSDWEIQINFCSWDEMMTDGEIVQGSVSISANRREAVISILEPGHYPVDTPFEQDLVVTVIHELLHVKLWPVFPDPPDDDALNADKVVYNLAEGMIQSMARSIVALDRGK